MAITVAQAEEFVVAIAGKLLGDAGLFLATDGANPDLRVPIDEALSRFADADGTPLAPAVMNAPTDADLAALLPWQARPFRAACLVETLHLLRARLADVDQTHGIDSMKLSQMGDQIAALLETWEPRADVALATWAVGPAIGTMTPVDDPGPAPWEWPGASRRLLP